MLEHLFSVAWSLADPRRRLRPHALLPSLFERHAAAKAATVDSWKRRSRVDPRCSRGSESEGQSPIWACDRLHGAPHAWRRGRWLAGPVFQEQPGRPSELRTLACLLLSATTRSAGMQSAQLTSRPDRPRPELPLTERDVPEVPSMAEGKTRILPVARRGPALATARPSERLHECSGLRRITAQHSPELCNLADQREIRLPWPAFLKSRAQAGASQGAAALPIE